MPIPDLPDPTRPDAWRRGQFLPAGEPPRYLVRGWPGYYVCLPGDTQIREIHWRGYLLLGPPGQRIRVPVYWLGEKTWDCYFEDELCGLSTLPF